MASIERAFPTVCSCGAPCWPDRALCKECIVAGADHPQVITRHGIFVDEDLKDVIEWLFDHDILTSNSCQGDDGECCWIQFESCEDEQSLLALAAAAKCPDLSEFLDDLLNRDEIPDDFDEDYVRVSWRFPREFLQEFKDILRMIDRSL